MVVISNFACCGNINFKPNSLPLRKKPNPNKHFKTKVNFENQLSINENSSISHMRNGKFSSIKNKPELHYVHFKKKKRDLANKIKVLLFKTTEQSTCTPFFIQPQLRTKKMRFYQYMPATYQTAYTLRDGPNVTEVSVHTKKGKSNKQFGKTTYSLPHTTTSEELMNNKNIIVEQQDGELENLISPQRTSNQPTDKSTLKKTSKHRFITLIPDNSVSKIKDLFLTTNQEIQVGATTHRVYEDSNYNSTDLKTDVTNSFLKTLFKYSKANISSTRKLKLGFTSNLTKCSNTALSPESTSEDHFYEAITNNLDAMYENASTTTEQYSEDSTSEFYPYTRLRVKDFFNFNNPLKSITMLNHKQKISTIPHKEGDFGNDFDISEKNAMTSLTPCPNEYLNNDNMFKISNNLRENCSEYPRKLQTEIHVNSFTDQMSIATEMANTYISEFDNDSLMDHSKENTSSNLLNHTFVTVINQNKTSKYNFPILKLFFSTTHITPSADTSPISTEASNTEINLSLKIKENEQTTYLSTMSENKSTEHLNTTRKQSRLNLKRIFQAKTSNTSKLDSFTPVMNSTTLETTQIQEPCSSSNGMMTTTRESFEIKSQKSNNLHNKKNYINYQEFISVETFHSSSIASDSVTNRNTDEIYNERYTLNSIKSLSDISSTTDYKNSKLKNFFNFKKKSDETVSCTPRDFDPGGLSLNSEESDDLLTPEELVDETSECGIDVCNSLNPEEMQALLSLHTKDTEEKSTTISNWFVRNFSKNQKASTNSVNEMVLSNNPFKWFPKQVYTKRVDRNYTKNNNISDFTTEAAFNNSSNSQSVTKHVYTIKLKTNEPKNIIIPKLSTAAVFKINTAKNTTNAFSKSHSPFQTSKKVPNLTTASKKVSKTSTAVSFTTESKSEKNVHIPKLPEVNSQCPITTPSNLFLNTNRGSEITKRCRGNLENKVTADHGMINIHTAPVRPFCFTRDHFHSLAVSETRKEDKGKKKPIATLRLNKSNSNVDFNPKHFGLLLHNLTRYTNSTLLVNPLEVYQMDSNRTVPKLNISKETQTEINNKTVSSNDSSIWAYVMKPLESLVNVFTGSSPHNITKIGDINASTIGDGSLPSHLQPANSSLIILAVNSTVNDVKETRIGLWDFVGGFFHCLVETFAEPKPEDIHFYLYTRDNSLQPEELNLTEELFPLTSTSSTNSTDDYLPDPVLEFSSAHNHVKSKRHYIDEEEYYEGFEPLKPAESGLESKWFNILRETKILVHGYRQNYQTDIVTNMKDAYLNKSDVNVVVVDWSFVGDNPCYVMVAHHGLRCVGRLLARFLDLLVEGGVSLSRVHLVGFSLGAHVAGHAGAETKHGLLSRITGLDPALPLIPMEAEVSLDEGDATFVDIIHSAAGYLGQPGPMGHADFYPNGGAQQPGCDLASLGGCSHRRSAFYFIESITSEIGFQATLCDSWQNFQTGICNGSSALPMGEPCPSSASGKYFLLTALKEPFALVPQEHNKVKKSLLIDIFNDIIYDL